MKERFEKYFSKQMIGFTFILCGGILLYFILNNLNEVITALSWVIKIFQPFFWGFIIAYFVNFPVNFFEHRVFKKIKNIKYQRVMSMTCGFIVMFVVVFLCIAIIVPQTIDSLTTLFNNAPRYINNFANFVTNFAGDHVWAADIANWATTQLIGMEDSLPSMFTDYVLPYTVNITTTVTSTILNLFIAIFVSIYLIAAKERFYAQLKKMLYAHVSKEKVDHLLEFTDLCNNTFSNFLSGKLIDSLIIGIISFISLSIFRFPYALLVAVIIGITNIIPFFGPIIGAIPSFFIILMIDPSKALWFLLFILILQQVDGNIIGPKILGYSIGLSAIWIIFAIIIGNELLGFVGMIIGVPAFAVFYTLFKSWSEKKLKEKNMPTETEDYATKENKIRF